MSILFCRFINSNMAKQYHSIRQSITSLIVYGKVAEKKINFDNFSMNFNMWVIEWGLPKKNLTEICNSNVLSMVERTSVSPILTGIIGNIKSQIKFTRTYKEYLVFCHPSHNIWKQLALGVTKKAILKKFV